jgi:hypothetical protein
MKTLDGWPECCVMNRQTSRKISLGVLRRVIDAPDETSGFIFGEAIEGFDPIGLPHVNLF